jgi:hypothetical protein
MTSPPFPFFLGVVLAFLLVLSEAKERLGGHSVLVAATKYTKILATKNTKSTKNGKITKTTTTEWKRKLRE